MTNDENLSASFSALPEHAANPSNVGAASFLSPTPASSPSAIVIKQERLSPVALTQEQDRTDSPLPGPHSTTTEQVTATASETGEGSWVFQIR